MVARGRLWIGLVGLAGIGLLLAGCGLAWGPMGPGGMGSGHPPMMGPGRMGPGMMGGGSPPPAFTPLPTATPGGDVEVSFRRDVLPIFNRSCVSCHGGTQGLWLNSYEGVMAGSQHGPVVVPGNPEESELYRRITGQKQPAMPLGGTPLPQREIEVIRRWIEAGAPNN